MFVVIVVINMRVIIFSMIKRVLKRIICGCMHACVRVIIFFHSRKSTEKKTAIEACVCVCDNFFQNQKIAEENGDDEVCVVL